MKLINKILFLSVIGIFSACLSCVSPKAIFQSNPPFKITNSYIQALIPGIREAKSYVEIGFEIESLPKGISLDSVSYNKKVAVKIFTEGIKKKVSIEESNFISKDNDIKLFYSRGKRKYYCELNEIVVKEDLLHP